jgi:hypothetical protein
LLFAQFPRQILQGVIVSSIFGALYSRHKNDFWATIVAVFSNDGAFDLVIQAQLLLPLQCFTIGAWLVSFFSLFIAFCIYIPLVTLVIRGNLKEYCVHKIDKRYENTDSGLMK